ncbi:MAG: isoprenylcysteine carboxylmethyltransferase family protein [Syntrophales bacterium]
MQKYPAYIVIFLAYVLGGSSLVMFGAFCYVGSLHLVRLGLNESGILFFDCFLSLAFFLQHSGMVRKSFRRFLSRFIPEAYVSAFYAISSGIVLFAVIIFWQESSSTVATAKDALRLLLRAIFAASLVGFYWGGKALGFFDPFGIRAIKYRLRGKKPKEMPLTISGPYRWVRHPLYLFVLLMIWSCPNLTFDRLLFNVLWTVWIYIGALLEERDLVADFGEAYREYKRKVPMLIPWRIYPSWPE